MKCILIFDSLNDIIYAKYNRKFAKHMNKYARSEGLLPDDQVKYKVGSYLYYLIYIYLFYDLFSAHKYIICIKLVKKIDYVPCIRKIIQNPENVVVNN